MAKPTNTIRKKYFGINFDFHPIVFPTAAVLLILFVVGTVMAPRRALLAFDWLQASISANFAWLYVAAMTGFLVLCIYLIFSRYGKIKLGADDAEPDFPTLTWFSMLFSAGMGIGMLFFGVAEPMWHYVSPPNMEGGTPDAARNAMAITMFHWCLHPWALYALVGLALAYFGFRRGLPLSFRSCFYPLIGDRIHGWIGDVIDIMAVLATLFGLATSLGLGAKQVNAGLAYVFGMPQGTGIQVILIACITTMAVGSLISGLDVGIRRLSELNMTMAGCLLLFLFIAGPTVYLLGSVVENTGAYLQRIPEGSFVTASYDEPKQSRWLGNWTLFYWGWWIAWSPFVGMFIARVSQGRTIREYLVGVLLVPSAVAIVWMTGFGNSALHQEIAPELVAETAGAQYNGYQERTYKVQVLDEETGLPQAKESEWLVGPDAKGIANPRGVLMKPKSGESGIYVAKDGTEVEYRRGVLVDRGTLNPYDPNDETFYAGEYEYEEQSLSLAGYLTKPVLNDDATHIRDTTSTAMFVMLEAYPLTTVTALVGTLCVILFFVTSSDSASMVADIIASGGAPDPALGTRLFWGILEGLLAAVLLVAGGLKALQTGSISIGLPFCLIIILMCYSLMRGLANEVEGRVVVDSADADAESAGPSAPEKTNGEIEKGKATEVVAEA